MWVLPPGLPLTVCADLARRGGCSDWLCASWSGSLLQGPRLDGERPTVMNQGRQAEASCIGHGAERLRVLPDRPPFRVIDRGARSLACGNSGPNRYETEAAGSHPALPNC